MKNLETEIKSYIQNATMLIANAATLESLEVIRIELLGRKGTIVDLMSILKTMSIEEKREFGPLLNQTKIDIETLFYTKKNELFNAALENAENLHQGFDVTAYTVGHKRGTLHPYTHLIEKIVRIFTSAGYQIADGPEIETDFYNFEALNIPPNHPARDMQDTFWLNVPEMLMRTHTSTVQIHTMEKGELPIAVITPGRVYRQEATDASHDFTFQQLEGLVIGKDISMADLLGTLELWLNAIFNRNNLKMRIRPSYFPFVEPGIEVDVSCPFCSKGCSTCKRTGWIEMGGAGLVHPNVLRQGGIDPTLYRGFAFGFGLTRLAMLLYKISDIRLLHEGNKEFLEQF